MLQETTDLKDRDLQVADLSVRLESMSKNKAYFEEANEILQKEVNHYLSWTENLERELNTAKEIVT